MSVCIDNSHEAEGIVAEFRELISSSIVQEQTRSGGVVHMGLEQTQIVNDLKLVHDARGNVPFLGLKGSKLWYIEKSRAYNPTVQLKGRLAIVSSVDDPNHLTRYWSFSSPFDYLSMETGLVINEVSILRGIVERLKTTGLTVDIFSDVAMLSPDEIDIVLTEADKLSQERQTSLDTLEHSANKAANAGRLAALIPTF